ncbi:hypothetical protein AVEN_202459-1 [Araneus ventricosus]|uniref:Reverse transcriptase domain-containing protein n=1 Tax=Araneus ventricosus TaxID=182803 RepID=A0A4Y2WA56_ARAVE|nr:hypothetical protein AVEN_202459-1 [Araneus ventricosus]
MLPLIFNVLLVKSRDLNFVYSFIDDILVASSSEEERLQHLQLLFERLDQYGLSINPSKCTFGVSTLEFLGFQASKIKSVPSRVKTKPEEVLSCTDEATTAFEQIEEALVQATLLHHPIPNTPLSIWVDTINVDVGGALTQYSDNLWQPLAFLSMKLTSSQKKWFTYDRELVGHLYHDQTISTHVGRKRACDFY